jgi:FMN phosphatase YigB (HAD superfamily)
MLEYMTLCANPTLFDFGWPAQPWPLPGGVPIGIISLPDFVVDVAIDGIKNATATRRGQIEPLDVGGRAGRLARVLQDFGGQRNAWYNVKYIAKAGEIGQLVLRRRFVKVRTGVDFEPVSLRYIIPSQADHEWLHVYGEMAETVESSYEGLEITVDELDQSPSSVTDLFVDARYVVIASKHSDHAVRAVSLVTEGLRRLSELFPKELVQDFPIPVGVLLDLSALDDGEDPRTLIGSFAEMKQVASAFAVETTALCDKPLNFGQEHFDHVLLRDSGTIRLNEHCEKFSESHVHPVTREALTAGYALASACNLGWKLLQLWARYCSNMRPLSDKPYKSWPQVDQSPGNSPNSPNSLLPSLAITGEEPISTGDRIKFAALLARFTESRPIGYQDLVRAVSRSKPQAQTEVEKQEVKSATTSEARWPARIAELEPKAVLNSHLVPRFDDPLAQATLSLHLPPSKLRTFAASCLLRDARRKIERPNWDIDKAVMFDLDATLIDSGGMLRACWFNGLRRFFKEAGFYSKIEDINAIIDLYQAFVYRNHAHFRRILSDQPDIPHALQPCDFRQVWNHPYAWGTLLWILNLRADSSQNGRGGSDETWRRALEIHRSGDNDRPCDICKRLKHLLVAGEERDQRRRDFTLAVRDQLIRFRFAIQPARRAFWEVDYSGYSQARASVQMLRATPGCEVYIVTEGHEETQLQKLKCAGLDDLFPRERVLSTSAASAAEEARNDLLRLRQSNNHVRNELQAIQQKAGKQAEVFFEPLLETFNAAIGSITFLADLLSVLNSKAQNKFYSAVIEAIRLNPESPARVLQSFLERRRRAPAPRSMKFFMIGDRYDNDCKPLLAMNLSKGDKVGVGTCRLLSGKRSLEYCPPKENAPPTQYVCDTLAQIAHVLHNTAAWEHIALLKDVTPPVLLEPQNGVVFYGPINNELQPLAPKFKDLSWARTNETLQQERAVREMLDQIERDLAVCDLASLSGLFLLIKNDMVDWWKEAHERKSDGLSEEPAASLLNGAIKVLTGVNWWRYLLRRPLLENRVGDVEETLEWTLGSFMLASINIASLDTRLGSLRWAEYGSDADLFDAKDILGALPYSDVGMEIVSALERDQPQFAERRVTRWLDMARSIPRN